MRAVPWHAVSMLEIEASRSDLQGDRRVEASLWRRHRDLPREPSKYGSKFVDSRGGVRHTGPARERLEVKVTACDKRLQVGNGHLALCIGDDGGYSLYDRQVV